MRRKHKTYDFKEKAEFRATVCSLFHKHCRDKEGAHVLILPAKEGLEIPILLRYGFRAHNIHAVDENAAIIAVATKQGWGKEHPLINSYGNKASRACQRIAAKNIRLSAANFDFSTNFNNKLITELEEIARTNVFDKKAIVSLTLLKGRESKAGMALLNMTGKKRVEAALEEALFKNLKGYKYEQLYVGEYNGKSTSMMQYAVYKIYKNGLWQRILEFLRISNETKGQESQG